MSVPPANPRRPGGQMASRPLHFFWLADASGSMRVDGKIQALNNAVREALPHMVNVARENPHATVWVRAMRFANRAEWLAEEPLPVGQFRWTDLEAGGETALGGALALMTEALEPPAMPEHALPPVIALITDGMPTDDFRLGLEQLMANPWGRRALRIVVAIGEDAAANDAREIFRAFVANDALRPFQANNPEALVEQIRWVSTAVLKSVSSPSSQLAEAPLPGGAAPATSPPMVEADIW